MGSHFSKGVPIISAVRRFLRSSSSSISFFSSCSLRASRLMSKTVSGPSFLSEGTKPDTCLSEMRSPKYQPLLALP